MASRSVGKMAEKDLLNMFFLLHHARGFLPGFDGSSAPE
jgi:hypothetical protein